MKPVNEDLGPLCLQTMMCEQWDLAFEFIFNKTTDDEEALVGGWLARAASEEDRNAKRNIILELIEELFARKRVDLALAWSFLAADQTRPETIERFLPQVARLFAQALNENTYFDDQSEMIQIALNVWHDAAAGQYVSSKVSIFAVAGTEVRKTRAGAEFVRKREMAKEKVEFTLPGLVVMPGAKATKLVNENSQYKELIDRKLLFVVASDVLKVRSILRREYPHATQAIDILTRDLREGNPVRMKPMSLVGEPGTGKSRLLRRLTELLGYDHVYKFDASSVSDSLSFSGTARGWGNTTPSVPVRASSKAGKRIRW